jgi:hypothetical protein
MLHRIAKYFNLENLQSIVPSYYEVGRAVGHGQD